MKTQRLTKTTFLILLAFALSSTPARAQSALEIMTKQKELLKTQDEYELQNVVLVNVRGEKKERKVERLTKSDVNNLHKILIRFLSPLDLKSTALLTLERKGSDDDQWLYLPSVGQPKRIASSGKKNRFMGTDFSYEDLRPEPLDSYSYKLVGSETCDGKPCYVIEAVPKTDKEKQDSGYSRRKFWILKDNFFPVKREFYDSAGTQAKLERSIGLKNIGGSVWRASVIEMEDVIKRTKTLLSVADRRINQRLSDQLFTERELIRGQAIPLRENVEPYNPPPQIEAKKTQEIAKHKEPVSTAKTYETSPAPTAKLQETAPPASSKEEVAVGKKSYSPAAAAPSGKSQADPAPVPAKQEVAVLKDSSARVTSTAMPAAFRLKMNIIGQRKESDGSYTEVFVKEGSSLRSRDNFQVHLETDRPAYVYILIYDSQNKASQLFPDAKIEQSGYVSAGKQLVLPGRDLWFWLDESPGTETIYVLASEKPMTDIRGLLAKMESADDAGQQLVSRQIKEKIAIMQRGIGGITKGQAVTYTLSDGKKIQKVTEVVTGTGSVVRAVSFLHR